MKTLILLIATFFLFLCFLIGGASAGLNEFTIAEPITNIKVGKIETAYTVKAVQIETSAEVFIVDNLNDPVQGATIEAEWRVKKKLKGFNSCVTNEKGSCTFYLTESYKGKRRGSELPQIGIYIRNVTHDELNYLPNDKGGNFAWAIYNF
jgi:hypothetical protein